ncbi:MULTISPECIES: BA14K family protein [Bradyrhizobium]|uniref:Lectin-like protein BA14k n=2 Tax=Bradyrhizobium TaxID=374 RepID=A0ABY0Q5U7_9BRAD|nr:BA14K-like protein [Bradyrhizobium ottawaense]SEC43426.1 BA14K-like protein [Bradyrhizobium lablabi]
MSKLRMVGATALSLALAVAGPAFAAGIGGGGGMHVGGIGGGGGMHIGGVGGGGGMHIGGVGVGGGGGMHIVGGGGAMHVGGGGFRGAQASIGDGRVGSVSGGNFTGHSDGQFAHGGYRGDRDRRHGYDRGVGFAGGLAAGSALGYGYGGYYDPYTYFGYYDPNYYNDGYAYNDPGYDGYSGSVVSSGADPSYCAQHYQSYDPVSGTYLGDDGLRHPCGKNQERAATAAIAQPAGSGNPAAAPSMNSDQQLLPEALVGHRQPRADQVTSEKNLMNPNDPVNQENAALDRMINGICRGC